MAQPLTARKSNQAEPEHSGALSFAQPSKRERTDERGVSDRSESSSPILISSTPQSGEAANVNAQLQDQDQDSGVLKLVEARIQEIKGHYPNDKFRRLGSLSIACDDCSQTILCEDHSLRQFLRHLNEPRHKEYLEVRLSKEDSAKQSIVVKPPVNMATTGTEKEEDVLGGIAQRIMTFGRNKELSRESSSASASPIMPSRPFPSANPRESKRPENLTPTGGRKRTHRPDWLDKGLEHLRAKYPDAIFERLDGPDKDNKDQVRCHDCRVKDYTVTSISNFEIHLQTKMHQGNVARRIAAEKQGSLPVQPLPVQPLPPLAAKPSPNINSPLPKSRSHTPANQSPAMMGAESPAARAILPAVPHNLMPQNSTPHAPIGTLSVEPKTQILPAISTGQPVHTASIQSASRVSATPAAPSPTAETSTPKNKHWRERFADLEKSDLEKTAIIIKLEEEIAAMKEDNKQRDNMLIYLVGHVQRNEEAAAKKRKKLNEKTPAGVGNEISTKEPLIGTNIGTKEPEDRELTEAPLTQKPNSEGENGNGQTNGSNECLELGRESRKAIRGGSLQRGIFRGSSRPAVDRRATMPAPVPATLDIT